MFSRTANHFTSRCISRLYPTKYCVNINPLPSNISYTSQQQRLFTTIPRFSLHQPQQQQPLYNTQLQLPTTDMTSSLAPISSLTLSSLRTTAPLLTIPFRTFFSSTNCPMSVNKNNQQPSDVRNRIEVPLGQEPEVKLDFKELRKKLSTQEFNVICNAWTDPRNIGYTKTKDDGVYHCKACEQALFTSESKFDSGCGWPAFDESINGAVATRTDEDGHRTEILCGKCHGHLGHVFKGEGFTGTNTRHCVNSSSITLVNKDTESAE